MPRRQSVQSDGRASDKLQKFNQAEYRDFAGTEPLMELDLVPFRKPTTGVRSSMAGIPALDAADRRLGLHYLRMPYYSREFWHAAWRKLYDLFTSFQTGNDTQWLERHWELRLINVNGMVANTEVEEVIANHIALMQHALYGSAHIALKFVAALNLARKQGFGNLSSKASATMKFAVLNSIFTKISNMPVNMAYIKACVASMADLVHANPSAGLAVYCPDWLPLGLAYFDDTVDLIAADTAKKWMNSRTYRHILAGEYPKSYAMRAANKWGAVATNDHYYGYGLRAVDSTGVENHTSVAAVAKGAWFFDHYLEQLQDEVDLYYETFMANSASAANLGAAESKVADFYASIGFFDDRLTFDALVKMVDEVKQLDLEDYARKNFHFCETVTPILRGNGVDPSLRADLADPTSSKWNLTTFDYVEQAADLAAMAELPYCGLKVKVSGGTLESFLDGLLADPIIDTATAFPNWGHSLPMQKIVDKKLGSYLTTTPRYVHASKVGEFVEKANDGNAMAYQALTKRGKFIPFWRITPIIDPNDRFTNGVFTIVDVISNTPRKGTYEDLLLQITKLASHATGMTDEDLDACKGLASGTAADQATTDSIFDKNGAKIGGVLLYLGDGSGVPAFTQIARGDIGYQGLAANNLTGDMNIVPAVPYRKVRPDFSIHPSLPAGTYATLLGSITAAFSANKDYVTVTDFPATMPNTLVQVDPATYPEMVLAPIFAPSVLRPVCEFTNFGLNLWFDSKFDYLKFQLEVPHPTSSATPKAQPAFTDPMRAKAEEKKARFDSRRSTKPRFETRKVDQRARGRFDKPTPIAAVETAEPREPGSMGKGTIAEGTKDSNLA